MNFNRSATTLKMKRQQTKWLFLLLLLTIGGVVLLNSSLSENNKIDDFYTEKYRPQFHYTPESNWMNDPNGMVYYDGEYHLFYQHHPDGLKWGPMHWGHAVSKDMINWEHLPIALYPDENGMIFSGSIVVDWKDSSGFFNGDSGLVAIFTHHDEAENQHQSIAYSIDKGRTWVKYDGNPVIPNPNIKDFRDPKVFWHKSTEKWVMVLAAGQQIMLYNSINLKNWEYMSEFGFNEGAHGGVWECPDLFELPVDGNPNHTKWVLQVDLGDGSIAGGSGGQYFIGHFDGKSFENESAPSAIQWVDYGADFYAAQSFSDIPETDGRRIWMAWMSNWKYANELPTYPWRSAMTIPREVELQTTPEQRIQLIQKPVKELQNLRGKHRNWIYENVLPDTNLLSGISGDLLEIVVEFEIDTAREFGFRVRKGKGQETVIGYDVENEVIFVDRTKSGESSFSELFAKRHQGRLKPVNNKIQMTILLDTSSLELFANKGQLVITDLIFPNEEGKKLELYSKDGQVKVVSLDIYELGTTWR